MNVTTETPPLTPPTLPTLDTNMHTITLYELSYIIILATMITMILNPEALVIWTQKLPVNPFTETLLEITQRFQCLMEQLNSTVIFNKLREAFRFFQSLCK